MNYSPGGRQKTLSIGSHPTISLSAARERRNAAKAVIAEGRDPSLEKSEARRAAVAAARSDAPTFAGLSERFQAKRARERAARQTLEKYRWQHAIACEDIGEIAPMELEPRHIPPMLQRLEGQGKLNAGQRVRAYIGQVMRWGISLGEAARDPSTDLRGVIPAPRARRHPAILDPDAFGHFLADCDGYRGRPVTTLALQIAPLVVLRSRELRAADWAELDFDAGVWRVPAVRMKGAETPGDHIVPLSRQAASLLRRLHGFTGRQELLFASGDGGVTLSESTINTAFRRLGYPGDQVTLHGLRKSFSTMANEAGWQSDWIERQLSHTDKSVRGSYNAAEYLDGRRELLQWWADRCDAMRGYAIGATLRLSRA